MALPLEKLLTPEDEELHRKKARLAELEVQLADRELDLASLLADLINFERRYLETVGRRYAVLDDLKFKIAEAGARQDPAHKEATENARQARRNADESARAAAQYTPTPERLAVESGASYDKRERSESLRNLYRQAAKLLHPDLTLDGDEMKRRHRVMAELNDAHRRGDENRIRAILREWHASPENVQGDGPGAELVRVIRKIAQVEKRLAAIAAEIADIRKRELYKLNVQVEEARAKGRDLLQELAEKIDKEILEAKQELKKASQASKR
jgi:hypothetical protein